MLIQSHFLRQTHWISVVGYYTKMLQIYYFMTSLEPFMIIAYSQGINPECKKSNTMDLFVS